MKAKLVLAAFAVVIALIVYQRIQARKKYEQPFRERLESWDQINYPIGPDTAPQGQVPFRTGKVFVMIGSIGSATIAGPGYSPPEINDAWHELPSSIRAELPEEVETLVITTKGSPSGSGKVYSPPRGDGPVQWQIVTETYRGPLIAFRVYDLKTKTLTGTATIEIPDIGKHAKPLARFIEAMPVR